VSAIPVNEVLLQDLNQLVGSNMLTSEFHLKNCFLVPIPRSGENARSSTPAEAQENSSRYLIKKQIVLEKISSDLANLTISVFKT